MLEIKLSVFKNLFRLVGSVIGILIVSGFSASAQDMNRNADLINFFSGQGCAIGPSTKLAAQAAGFSNQAIDQLSETARADPDTIKTGQWLVLSPETCEIELPLINSRLLLSDPEVSGRFSAVDIFAAEGNPGCFFILDGLFEELALTRGWDKNTANREYLGMLGAALISGDIVFYGENPLATPYGFMLTKGACAEVPNIIRIKQNYELLVRHFGALLRENAKYVACADGASLFTPEFRQIARNITENRNKNEWLFLEIQVIGMGAGWYEGQIWARRGMPRPPLCQYE